MSALVNAGDAGAFGVSMRSGDRAKGLRRWVRE